MSSSVYNYTFTGFGVQVELDGVQTICTGATVNFGQKILNSAGSFGGGVDFEFTKNDSDKSTENYRDKTIQANGPPRTDVPQITISLSFEMTTELMEKFFGMLETRKDPYKITISGAGGSLTLNNCYWNKISLQVQQNSLMTGSVDFNVLQTYATVYNFVMYARNSNSTNENNFGLFGSNFDCHLIPYYATAVKLNGGDISFSGLSDPTAQIGAPTGTAATGGENFIPTAWSLDISQQVSFRTFCRSSSAGSSNSSVEGENTGVIKIAPIAKYIAFGMVNCNLNITTLVDAGNGLKINNLKPSIDISIDISGTVLNSADYIQICYLDEDMKQKTLVTLKYLQLMSANPNFADSGNYMSCQLSYQANKILIKTKTT